MSTAHRLPDDAPTPDLPGDLPAVPDAYEVVPDAELTYGERAAWTHAETGLRVKVKRDRQPTQMHTPETSRDDVGFRSEVRDENYTAPLSFALAAKVIAYEQAVRFMAAYPDGDYEVPHPRDQPYQNEPVDWEPEP